MEYFTKEHEWIRVEGDIGTIGITKHAAEHLGDVVFVDLPAAGRAVKQNEQIAVVESVKAASDIYAPVSGEIVAANEALVGTPAGVNESPEDSASFFKVRIAEPSELASLMDRAAYEAFLAASA